MVSTRFALSYHTSAGKCAWKQPRMCPAPTSFPYIAKATVLPAPSVLSWLCWSHWCTPRPVLFPGLAKTLSVLHPCSLPLPHKSCRHALSSTLSCSDPKTNGKAQSMYGMPLKYLALVARGACIFGPHETNNWKESSGEVTTPGHYTDTNSNIPSLPLKKAHLIVLKLQSQEHASADVAHV